MPQKARKRAKTSEIGVRDRLLDAADRLFYREGVRAVGIDRVLAEADAAKASLYQHFGCKDQLVASYLERRTVDARANIEAYLADTPPSQRALKFFDWVVDWAESKDFRGCPLQHTVSELTDPAHPARAIAYGQREWFTERFSQPPTIVWPSIERRAPVVARQPRPPRRHRRTARSARERSLSRPSPPPRSTTRGDVL